YTCAFAVFSFAMLSRNVHSSFVHTPLNAAGKNASTTGWPFCELSVTGSRFSFIRVKSGAFDPTVAAIKPPRIAFSVGIVVKKGFTRDRGSAPHETLRPCHGCRRRQFQSGARGNPRLPRPQRRRQDDDHADSDRVYAGIGRQS